MKRFATFVAMSLLLAACSALPQQTPASADITVGFPKANAVVQSPLTVTGTARGTWYFEASFPIKLLDDQGNELASAVAQAQGDWMTEDFVPFVTTLTFTTTAKMGTLVLQKDNPSGMPENDKSVSIPVRFE
ncbi:MAG: hypothetical protein HOO67_00405 [Candidatus Peribacteraceae bacterium]|nr:hypothetical protein [Candidatus Peribacteraceae bacterium]